MTRGFFVTENPLRGFPVMFGSLLRAGNVRVANISHTGSLRGILRQVHAPAQNGFSMVGITVCGEKQKPRDDPRFCNKKKERKMKKMKDDLSLLYRLFMKKKREEILSSCEVM